MGSRRPRRSAVMVPGRWAGIDLPDARATRVEVCDDTSIVVTTAAGERVAAGPGEVTRLVVVPEKRMPSWAEIRSTAPVRPRPTEYLAMLSGPQVRLVLRLSDFTAHQGDRTSQWAAKARDSSGADAMAAALGLPLEGATSDDIALLRSPDARAAALLFPISGANGPRWATAQVILGMVVAFLGWMRGYGWDAAVAGVIGAVIVAPVFWRVFRLRRLFLRVVDSLPDIEGAAVVSPAAPPTRGLAETRLILSPERVVLHCRGTEQAATGPALGGITRCIISTAIVFVTHSKVGQIALARPLWCPTPEATERFAAACEAVGIHCDVLPEDTEMLLTMDEGPAGGSTFGGIVPYPYQTGSVQLGVAWLLILAAGMLTASGLVNAVVAPLDDQPLSQTWWGIPFTLVAGAAFVATVVNSLAVSRWDRHQRRRVRHVPA